MAEPPLSIIIPVLNEAGTLPQLLNRLQPWRAVLEIIVVDGGSRDATVALAQQRADRVLVVAAGRAAQMNAGAAVASGAVLLFVHSDSELPDCVRTLPGQIAATDNWGFFSVALSGRDWRLRCIEWAMNRRSRWTHIATGDQCLWLRRRLWQDCGGFADLPLMEDIELCRRLRRRQPPRIVAGPVVTSSRRWQQRGIGRTVLLMWWLRLAWRCGVDPARLARQYRARAH